MLYCFCFIQSSFLPFILEQYFTSFLCVVFVVADKSNVICILLINYIVCHVVFVLFWTVIEVMKVINGC